MLWKFQIYTFGQNDNTLVFYYKQFHLSLLSIYLFLRDICSWKNGRTYKNVKISFHPFGVGKIYKCLPAHPEAIGFSRSSYVFASQYCRNIARSLWYAVNAITMQFNSTTSSVTLNVHKNIAIISGAINIHNIISLLWIVDSNHLKWLFHLHLRNLIL